MRILKYELKKIWHPGMVLGLAMIGVVFGYLFLEVPLKYFPTVKEQYEQMKQWTKKYGTTLEENEYTDAKKKLSYLIDKADKMIRKDKRFTEDGITSYKEFENAKSQLLSSEEEEGREPKEWEELLYSEEVDRIGYQIEVLSRMLYEYEIRYSYLEEKKINQPTMQQARIDDLILNHKLDGIMPYEVLQNINEYSRWAITFILFSVLMFLAPVVIRDRFTNMQQLQWSSKRGRKVLGTQLGAVLLSTMILVAIELIILVGAYSTLGTQYFWNNSINSFECIHFFWFDLTYGQYVMCIIGITIILSLGMAGISFVLSRYSSHYISLLFKAVPVFALFVLFIHIALYNNLFEITNGLNRMTSIAGIEVWTAIGIFLISMVMSACTLWYEKKCEVNQGIKI